jgi:hypothetical protein
MADVAEAITRFANAYIAQYRPPGRLRGILELIRRCRTAALGGRLFCCQHCGRQVPLYNSCGNRHCPTCQGARRAEWVEQREQELLPLPYFHTVFTLPHALLPLVRANPSCFYNLLFGAAAATLNKFGRDPRHGLEGQLGFLAVLHTWDRTLGLHPHVHIVVPAAALLPHGRGLRVRRGGRWLFPVQALSLVFRGIFLQRLKRLAQEGSLEYNGPAATLAEPARFQQLLDELYGLDWVVYAKRPCGGPPQVLRYLARYTHRVAISNARIRCITDTTVSFAYRDRRQPTHERTMTLPGVEFLRRFAQHILPPGFTRVRFYGFWGNSVKTQRLVVIRDLLGVSEPALQEPALNSPAPLIDPPTEPLRRCPYCGQQSLVAESILPRSTGPPPLS